VLGMGLLGLQDVQARYGRTSEQATLAKEAVRLALRWAVEQLDAALDGDITYQVGHCVVLEDVPGGPQCRS